MTIRDLYQTYNIMPQLIEHQLRVGAIVKLITNDKASIITALVHDMGNLAKFSGLDEHWSQEQTKFWSKYGRDAHEATIKILREAGLDKYRDLIEEEAKFYREVINLETFETFSLPAVLTLYADSRVAITGVVSLEERIIDLETRYNRKRNDWIWGPKLEKYVQSLTTIDIRSIKDRDVEPLFDELLTYEIE